MIWRKWRLRQWRGWWLAIAFLAAIALTNCTASKQPSTGLVAGDRLSCRDRLNQLHRKQATIHTRFQWNPCIAILSLSLWIERAAHKPGTRKHHRWQLLDCAKPNL